MKKKILVFAPFSPHTAKFIEMIDDEVEYHLICSPSNLNVDIPREYIIANPKKNKRIYPNNKICFFL